MATTSSSKKHIKSHFIVDNEASTSKSSVSSILSKGDILTTTTVFEDIQLSLYKFKARTIVADLNSWAFNRNVNEEHVKKIYNDLCKQKQKHLMGTIKAVFAKKEDVFQLIDGQHRTLGLSKFVEDAKNQSTDFDLFIEVYHVKSIHDKDVYMLYKTANNNLNVSVEDDVDMRIVDIVDALCADPVIGKGITDENNKRTNKPKISKKKLYEAIKENIRAQDLKLPTDEIVRRVKNINVFIRNVIAEKYHIDKIIADDNRNALTIAIRSNFYLNLETKYLPERWIAIIGDEKFA